MSGPRFICWCLSLAVLGCALVGSASVSRAEMLPIDADLTVSLSGFVYADVNNSGEKDESEMGLSGVSVMLEGVDQQGEEVNRLEITGKDGSYWFADLWPGIYSVTEITPDIYIEGEPNEPGTAGGVVADSNQFSDIVLAEGVHAQDYNFGEWGLRPEFISKRPYLVVPEPSTLALLALGLLTLGAARPPRYRRRHHSM